MEKSDKMLLAHIGDLLKRSREKNIPLCTGFLNINEQSIVLSSAELRRENYVLSGGFEDAERKVMLCLPDYDVDIEDFISLLRLTHSEREKLSHRDYLGALMGLGIERENIGDILVMENGAEVIIKKDMAEFLVMNLSKAGRVNLKAEVLPLQSLVLCQSKAQEALGTVSSLRADALLSSAFNLSRNDALEAIRSKQVFINDILLEKPEKLLKSGDKIKYARHGRAILTEAGNTTRKGRIAVKFDLYK